MEAGATWWWGQGPWLCDRPADKSAYQNQQVSEAPSQWEDLGLWSAYASQGPHPGPASPWPGLPLQLSCWEVSEVLEARLWEGLRKVLRVEGTWEQKSHHEAGK